jgi:ABC-type lipoprotein release transport system permease subunit
LVLFSSVRSFSYYLFGVQALEPVVLALVGAVAAIAPVRRAVAVQPMDALRHE